MDELIGPTWRAINGDRTSGEPRGGNSTPRKYSRNPASDDRGKHRIGYIGHTPGLSPELTLGENLRFVAEAMGLDRDATNGCLDMVGLAGAIDRRADRCSHGMQRRAEFARAHLTAPDLLLLDEPHSALDDTAVALVDDLVRRTVERGGAAVLVSHERQRVTNLSDRTFEIEGGTLV
jgi:ABC-type multidrug transport system ATPase subunit